MTLDIFVIVAYLVGVAAMGIALRGRQEGVSDYFLGSRRIAWPLILLSIVATETSTVTFLSVPGVAYGSNMRFLQLPIGYLVGRLGVAILIMPHFFRGEPLTLYEILGRRFGHGIQRLTSILFVITRSIADGLRLFLTALVVHELTQWDFVTSVLVVGAATIVYTYFGGIRAVIWTDVVQFVIYMLGAFVAGWVLLRNIPSGWSGVIEAGQSAGKFTVFDFAFDLTAPYSFWAGLIGGAFLTAATHGADQMMVQRYLCTNSVAHARLALVSSGFVVLAQFFVFLLLGVGLYAFYAADPPSVRNDAVFVKFIIEHVPAGLRGLIIAAIFSAAMSTLSSSLNSVSSAIITDIYRPLIRPGAAERHYLHAARVLTFAAGLVQMGVALYGYTLPDRSTVDNVLTVAAFTTGITLGTQLLGLFSSQATGRAAALGMVNGAAMVTCLWAFTPVAWPWYALYGSIVTLLTGLAASSAFASSYQSTAISNQRPSPPADA
jgi:SSS family transporter